MCQWLTNYQKEASTPLGIIAAAVRTARMLIAGARTLESTPLCSPVSPGFPDDDFQEMLRSTIYLRSNREFEETLPMNNRSLLLYTSRI